MGEELSRLMELLVLRLDLLERKYADEIDPQEKDRIYIEMGVLSEISEWLLRGLSNKNMGRKKKKKKKKKKKSLEQGFFKVPLKLSDNQDVTIFYDLEGAKEFAARINSVVLTKDDKLTFLPSTEEVLKYNEDHLDEE